MKGPSGDSGQDGRLWLSLLYIDLMRGERDTRMRGNYLPTLSSRARLEYCAAYMVLVCRN